MNNFKYKLNKNITNNVHKFIDMLSSKRKLSCKLYKKFHFNLTTNRILEKVRSIVIKSNSKCREKEHGFKNLPLVTAVINVTLQRPRY